ACGPAHPAYSGVSERREESPMGGGGYDVEIGQMDLAQQLFQRQQEHMAAVGSYVGKHCTASGAFDGLIMSTMRGHYTDCLSSATTGMGHGAEIAGHCSDKIQQTQHTYLAMDRKAYERFAAQQKAAGIKVGAYQPPAGGGVLGPPQEVWKQPSEWNTSDGKVDGNYVKDGWGAARTALGGTAQFLKKGTLSTDPTHNWNRQPYTWREEGWDWKKWGGDKTLELANNGRARWDAWRGGHHGQTGQERAAARYQGLSENYDHRYDQTHRLTGSHLPDGTRYEGAADADGNVVNDKRPGSAWTQGLKDDIKVMGEAKEAYGTVTEAAKAGQELYGAAANDIHVHEVAGGPSNSGSWTWSGKDKGGTW
ncbi:MAG: hypothetical protein ACXVGT_09255, partial [Oryzihumus sp.]